MPHVGARDAHLQVVALQHLATEQHRRDRRSDGDEQAGAQQPSGVEGRGLVELVATGGEVADHQRHAGDQTAGEPATGQVVAGEQQVDRGDDQRTEQQAGDDLEDQGAGARRQGLTGPQPHAGVVVVLVVVVVALHRFGGAGDVGGARAQEDQRRDTGGRDDQHRDLAEGVPGAHVDECDIDDVLAVAELVGEFVPPVADRGGGARTAGHQRHERHGGADEQRHQHPPPAGRAQRTVGEVARQFADDQHEDDEADRLDEHLGEREVGCARHHEHQREAVTGDAGEQHRAQPSAGGGGEEGRPHHDDRDRDLHPVVEQAHAGPVLDAQQREQRHADEDDQDRAEVDRQRTTLGARRRLHREAVDAAHRAVVEVLRGRGAGEGGLHGGDAAAGQEESDAGGDRDHRHEQRPGEAVPQRQAVARLAGADRLGVGREQFGERVAEEPADQAGEPEQRRHQHHADRRTVPVEFGGTLLLCERAPPPPQAVGHGDRRPEDQGEAEHRRRQRRHRRRLAGDQVGDRLERGFLGDEADQRREARHRQRREPADDREPRNAVAHAAELLEVSGARAVVDDADAHEQRRLEQGVRDDEPESGQRGRAGADADEQHHEAQLADGAVGEQEFEVGLTQRPPTTDEHRGGAEQQHGRSPEGHVGERRRQHRHQVDTGLHHRGRVQVGRDRGGGSHRAGQPEVERDEGRLAQRAHQHEQHRDGDDHALGRGRDDLAERVGAGLVTERDDADEHREATGRGHQQRGVGGASVGPAGRVVGDEQVGEDRGQLPEDVHQHEVVGGDEAEHGAGEDRQDRAAAHRHLAVEVPPAVDEHERADPTDHHRQHPLHESDVQVEVDPERGDPGVLSVVGGAVGDGRHQLQQPDARRQRHQRQREEGAGSEPAGERRGQRTRHCMSGNEYVEHARRPSVWWLAKSGSSTILQTAVRAADGANLLDEHRGPPDGVGARARDFAKPLTDGCVRPPFSASSVATVCGSDEGRHG